MLGYWVGVPDDERSGAGPRASLSLFFLLLLAAGAIYVLSLILRPFLLGILMSAVTPSTARGLLGGLS